MRYQWTIAHTWDGLPVSEPTPTVVSLELTDAGYADLKVTAPFYGDPAPPSSPGSLWGLWEFEVVELFIVGTDGPYVEIELGPHGHYLVLRLDAPRSIVERHLEVDASTQINGKSWTGSISLKRDLLPTVLSTANAFAINGTGASRRYLAHSAVPGKQPNFHQPGLFPPMRDALTRSTSE